MTNNESALERPPLDGRLSRRRFLQGAVGGAAGVGLGAWGALALSRGNAGKRRFAPDAGLSLAEYIVREAPNVKVLPYELIVPSSVRFRATLTFERYLTFFRYKEKVLASTKEEVDDCVRRIESFSCREKALILFATRLFDCYENRYRNLRKRGEARSKSPKKPSPHYPVFTPSADAVEARSYAPDVRPYFPYYYPALAFDHYYRPLLILGEPSPDRSVDKVCLQSWSRVRQKYRSNKEVAFPGTSVVSADLSNVSRCEEIAWALKASPLRFPMGFYPPKSDGAALGPPYFFGKVDQKRGDFAFEFAENPPFLFGNDKASAVGDLFKSDYEKNFWIKWIENIVECVGVVERELGLKIPAERWVSDFYPDADAFLKKVAELEKDESTPYEKIELLTALREYWFSMQIDYDYDIYGRLPMNSIGQSPFRDVIESKPIALGDVAQFY